MIRISKTYIDIPLKKYKEMSRKAESKGDLADMVMELVGNNDQLEVVCDVDGMAKAIAQMTEILKEEDCKFISGCYCCAVYFVDVVDEDGEFVESLWMDASVDETYLGEED